MDNLSSTLKKRLIDFASKSWYYSPAFAFWDLLWWVCFYTHIPMAWKLSSFAIRRKTDWLDRYVEQNYGEIIDVHTKSASQDNERELGDRRIWVFWGQGENNMPLLIRACYNQLVSLNERVTLITKANISEFLDIPEVIYHKVERGTISWAHFSDIIRTSLLARYGGVWMDATVWTTRPFPFEELGDLAFYSVNGKVAVNNRTVRFWTSFEWNWSGWCLYANYKNDLLYSFVSQMLINLAQREQYLLDYVLIDYLIYYACRKFPGVGEAMNECNKIECSYRNRLAELMNCRYNEDEYNNLISTDYIFKLSFRSNYKCSTQAGETTYFGTLIDKG